jgi:proline iminopeptidase
MTPASVRSSLQGAQAWTKALAPYVARTITLQRPVANRKIRRASTCRGIDEYFPLDINGHWQWLRIRGERPDNPVILYLHGGPGGSQIPSYRHFQLGWERDFTIVHWEQRGAGKSYSRRLDFATMTLSQLVADALEVIRFLANRFECKDIVILGHSWGTFLGIHVLQQRPADVAAYIGVGQVANQIESERRMYQFVLNSAIADDNRTAIEQLGKLRGYPISPGSFTRVPLVRRWARHYRYLGSGASDTARTYARLMNTPEYGPADVYRFLKGTLVSFGTLGRVLLTQAESQPTALALRFDVPMFRSVAGATISPRLISPTTTSTQSPHP